jgi:hypothetical protein
MKLVRPLVPPCVLSLRNVMANVYEHLLHGRGTVALLCPTPVRPLIAFATVDLSTKVFMTLWLFLPGIFERQPAPVGMQS